MKLKSSRGSEFSRRFLLTGAFTVSLSGCTAATLGESSTYGGRRGRSLVDEAPLTFDISEGFRKLNAVRNSKWLPAFAQEPRLQKAAQLHANMMGKTGLYGHDIGRGTDFKTRIFSVGFDNSAGENIGVGYRSVDEAITGWMESPGHRRNMLKRKYNGAGLAYAFNTSGKNPRFTHYWVLIMGKV